MPRVRATCTACGDVDLSVQQVTVTCGRVAAEGIYEFSCPSCGLAHSKAASRQTLDLLIASGSQYRELIEPIEHLVGADLGPMSSDQVKRYLAWLHDEDAVAQAMSQLSKEHKL